MNSDQQLLSKLCIELVQAETSARLHPRREADRLGDCPPAKALRAVSEDAEQVRAVIAFAAASAEEDLPVPGVPSVE